jgi:glutamate 2,3-aminomutase
MSSKETTDDPADFVPIEDSSLHVTEEARRHALERCREYREAIEDYLEAKPAIPWGLDLEEQYAANRRRVLAALGGDEDSWADWRWHLRHVIRDTATLAKILPLQPREIEEIEHVSRRYRWGISPYYASLMDPDDPACPVRRQAVPSVLEVEDPSVIDEPETVKTNSPAPGITRLYPDRLIINVTNACSMFCRHCLRRRDIGFQNLIYSKKDITSAVQYVRENPEIRDVLITGGDALMLRDDYLDWLLGELDAIEHVEVKRIGSRTPVVLPMRITDELCRILERHSPQCKPLYLMTQFNHSREITRASAEVVEKLTRHGVLVADQTVLLRGVNCHRDVMKKLMQDLARIKVRPYYIFHCKKLPGVKHFRAQIEDGLDIMEHMRGYTSGLAVPTYIITAPDGRGKTPVQPIYVVNTNAKGKVLVRTWGGYVMTYDNER